MAAWLPEPLVTEADEDITLDESISTALMVVLERLSPAQRTAFLLHDVFGLAFEQVAEIVGRSPAAVRQLAARARAHVDAGKPRFPASEQEAERVVSAFAQAWQEGEHAPLLALLDPDVVLRADGGGHVAAARKPLRGADRVARALASFARVAARLGQDASGRLVRVNGSAGLVVTVDGVTDSVVALTIDGGRITVIDIVRNPEKLSHIPPRAPR